MNWQLRGDWTGRTSGNHACYKRWILASERGDFEEDCTDGTASATIGLWWVQGNELRITFLKADRRKRPTEVRFLIERISETSFELREADSGVQWDFARTNF